MKLHAFNTAEQPPLCGQKDRHGKHFLPAWQTTPERERVTCAKCLSLMSDAVTMRERPILFKAPMVQALLADRKTQTRRIVKPQPFQDPNGHGWQWHGGPALERAGFGARYVHTDHESMVRAMLKVCPHSAPGERLWVRETWQADPIIDDTWASTQRHGCKDSRIADLPERFHHPRFCNYRADWLHGDIRWRPAIFMPRWASRITLEVVGVRAERLNEISRGDAMEEGCPFPNMAKGDDPRQWYADLWEQINGASSWAANFYVWVIQFKRIS